MNIFNLAGWRVSHNREPSLLIDVSRDYVMCKRLQQISLAVSPPAHTKILLLLFSKTPAKLTVRIHSECHPLLFEKRLDGTLYQSAVRLVRFAMPTNDHHEPFVLDSLDESDRQLHFGQSELTRFETSHRHVQNRIDEWPWKWKSTPTAQSLKHLRLEIPDVVQADKSQVGRSIRIRTKHFDPNDSECESVSCFEFLADFSRNQNSIFGVHSTFRAG